MGKEEKSLPSTEIFGKDISMNTGILQPHQQRVVDERQELNLKIDKLTAFLAGPIFTSLPSDEQLRLTRQHAVMTEYSGILTERIAHF
jgi:hypothetical protein